MAQQRLSITLPLSLGDSDGPYLTHDDMESVAAQNLKMIVLTSPGERVMDSSFGVGIRSYLFEQATPYLDPDNGFLLLKINYMVPGSSNISEMMIPVAA